MYNQLTMEHSLHVIDEQTFQEFLDLANRVTLPNNLTSARSHNTLDTLAVVLHNWCFLQANKRNLYLDSTKSMLYSCNFFVLGVQKKDVKLKNFLSAHALNDEMTFVFAHYMGYALLQWVDQLLTKHKEGLELMEINEERDYFLLAETEQAITDEAHAVYVQQKFITHLLATDLSSTENYSQAIDSAITFMRDYLKQQPALMP